MTNQQDMIRKERQLTTMLRAESNLLRMPSNTWQQLVANLGEPDNAPLFRRLQETFAVPSWRNPMQIRYVATAFTALAVIVVVLLFVVLTNGDDDTTDSAPASSPLATATIGTGNSESNNVNQGVAGDLLQGAEHVRTDIQLSILIAELERQFVERRNLIDEMAALAVQNRMSLVESNASAAEELNVQIDLNFGQIRSLMTGSSADPFRYADLNAVVEGLSFKNNEIMPELTSFGQSLLDSENVVASLTLSRLIDQNAGAEDSFVRLRELLVPLLSEDVESGAVAEYVSESFTQPSFVDILNLEHEIRALMLLSSLEANFIERRETIDETAALAVQNRMVLVEETAKKSLDLSADIAAETAALSSLISTIEVSGSEDDRYSELRVSVQEFADLDAAMLVDVSRFNEALLDDQNVEAAQTLSRLIVRTEELVRLLNQINSQLTGFLQAAVTD